MLHNAPLMGTLWTDALSLHNPAAPRLRWIRFFSPPRLSGWCREGGRGAISLPSSGRVWHQHCSIITAKSCWWKTLGLLRQAISINIYARLAGNRMKPSFWCLWRRRRKIWCKSQMWESHRTPSPLRQSSGMWHEHTLWQLQMMHSLIHVKIRADCGLPFAVG